MSTTGTERHCRLSCMLIKAGTKTNCAFLEKRVKDLSPDPTSPWSLDDFLKTKQKDIQRSKLSKEKYRVLFPVNGATDIKKWDLSLLCHVLVRYCQLDTIELLDVEMFRKVRNKICHVHEPNIDDDKFNNEVKKIKTITTRILQIVDNPIITDEVTYIINDMKEGPLSLDETVSTMHIFYSMERDIREKLDTISDDERQLLEIAKRTERKVDDMRAASNRSPSVTPPAVDFYIDIKNISAEKEARLSECLVELFEARLNGNEVLSTLLTTMPPESFQQLRETVNETFQIFLSSGWEISEIKHECVLLKIQCRTISAVAALFRDCVEGRLLPVLENLEKRCSMLDGYSNVEIEPVIYRDTFFDVMEETFSSIENNILKEEIVVKSSDTHSICLSVQPRHKMHLEQLKSRQTLDRIQCSLKAAEQILVPHLGEPRLSFESSADVKEQTPAIKEGSAELLHDQFGQSDQETATGGNATTLKEIQNDENAPVETGCENEEDSCLRPLEKEQTTEFDAPGRSNQASYTTERYLSSAGMPQPSGDIAESHKLSAKAQVCNHRDAYVFQLSDMSRLLRFLVIGCDGGSYYAKERDILNKNVDCIQRLIAEGHGVEVLQKIKEVSLNKRNVNQKSLMLAYAICATSNDNDTKKAAYALLSEICRIPTHLFMFIKYCKQESRGEGTDSGTGWGRAFKRAVGKWYTSFDKDPEKLARLVTKFKTHEGWSHRDVLRLAHTSSNDKAVGFILRYITKGLENARAMYLQNPSDMDQAEADKLNKLADLIIVFDTAINITNEDHLCSMIKEYHLTWEQCNSDLLKGKKVWITLLPHMSIEETIRNLGRMTSYGMLYENSEEEQMVLDKISSINTLSETPVEVTEQAKGIEIDNPVPEAGKGEVKGKRKNVLHPFKVLLALITYKTGHGDMGSRSWIPNKRIMEALDRAFHQAFETVEPTGKKYYLAVDVSSSMSQPVLRSTNIHCATAAAAMLMVTARTEKECIIRGFSHKMVDIGIDVADTIDIVQKKMDLIPVGGSDCAKPIFDAMESKIKDIDVFIVYTDNETGFGNVQPCEALRQYRQYSERPNAKLIVCGMCSTEFTIADQDDPNMLDVVGFDSAAPRLISEFAMDKT